MSSENSDCLIIESTNKMASKGPKLRVGPFDVTEDRLNCGRLWARWLERFERDLVYSGVVVAEKLDMARAALLIYQML